MNLLFVGDVVGKDSCEFLAQKLYKIKREYDIDITVVNGENSASGNGITKASLDMLVAAGADIVTTGNHCFKRREFVDMYDSCDYLCRPCNYPEGVIGRGVAYFDAGRFSVAVVNLQGVVYMQPLDNPFNAIDKVLSEIDTPNIIVDFHAEATAEKKAMAYYLDGRVTALLGTHTHVQTADEIILPQKTAYITDVGMTGAEHSVLGVDTALAIEKQKMQYPVRFVESKEPCMINAVVVSFDEKTGKSYKIVRINEK